MLLSMAAIHDLPCMAGRRPIKTSDLILGEVTKGFAYRHKGCWQFNYVLRMGILKAWTGGGA